MEAPNNGGQQPLNSAPQGGPPMQPNYSAPPFPPQYGGPPPQYGGPQPGYAPPNQQHSTSNVIVVNTGGHNQQQHVIIDQGFCSDAMVDVSETGGLVILILNIISPGFGTLISSCMDREGCNFSAFCLAWLQSLLVFVCLLGWVMSIMHGLKVYEFSKGKH